MIGYIFDILRGKSDLVVYRTRSDKSVREASSRHNRPSATQGYSHCRDHSPAACSSRCDCCHKTRYAEDYCVLPKYTSFDALSSSAEDDLLGSSSLRRHRQLQFVGENDFLKPNQHQNRSRPKHSDHNTKLVHETMHPVPDNRYDIPQASVKRIKCSLDVAKAVHYYAQRRVTMDHHLTMVYQFGMHCDICHDLDMAKLGYLPKPVQYLDAQDDDPWCFWCGTWHPEIDIAPSTNGEGLRRSKKKEIGSSKNVRFVVDEGLGE